MKLDRETEALLHWVSSATVTPLWSLAPAAARDEYRRTLAKTEIVPPEIEQVSGSRRGGPGGVDADAQIRPRRSRQLR